MDRRLATGMHDPQVCPSLPLETTGRSPPALHLGLPRCKQEITLDHYEGPFTLTFHCRFSEQSIIFIEFPQVKDWLCQEDEEKEAVNAVCGTFPRFLEKKSSFNIKRLT